MLPAHRRIQTVGSFDELVTTRFAEDVNALCWPRSLPGDFAEIVAQIPISGDITTLDEASLGSLSLSPAGQLAADFLLQDLLLLRQQELDPVLNCIHGYLRDEDPGPVPTDVFSFHVDSATTEADTWLCTYFGPPSEGLPNEQAQRRIDVPSTRAELLAMYGGQDDRGFVEFLQENCYDLHYVPLPGAHPYSFGLGHLWRIATQHPGSPVPPCIHRAPETLPGQQRLLLIS